MTMVTNCHERGLGRNHRYEGQEVGARTCVRCGAVSVGYERQDKARQRAQQRREAQRLQRTSARGENGQETPSRVAAALEAGRVRPVVVRRAPQAAARCPRCGGRVLRETDERGEPDDHCVSCSYRMDTPSPEVLAALMAERNGYDDSGRRVRERVREPRMAGGMG